MKKSRIIVIGSVALIVGAALGYYVGQRRGFKKAFTQEERDYRERTQLNMEFEARAYLRCLQDIDSGNITNLHEFALGHLRYYVWDVQQSRQEGYTWAPHIPWLYSNATTYLTEYPRKK
jgi:hypothetical protein